MRARVAFLAFLALPLAAAACPAPRDFSAERDALLTELAQARDFGTAQERVGALWRLWRTAPDEPAQHLLDTGVAAIRYGDLLRAERQLSRLVEYCPDYAEGWNQLAFALFLQERDKEAAGALERALALEPKHFGALSGMGLIALRAGRTDEARLWLERAVRLNPWLNERGLLEALPEAGSEL